MYAVNAFDKIQQPMIKTLKKVGMEENTST
jgi:hypothetical protein